MNGETPEIILKIFQIMIITLSTLGGLFCVYSLGCFIFRRKSGLYIKGGAYLILDIDAVGDKLEYYVRKIENDIDRRYIYISKIILYSKNLTETGELYKICAILSGSYHNIIFPAENTDINLLLRPWPPAAALYIFIRYYNHIVPYNKAKQTKYNFIPRNRKFRGIFLCCMTVI